MLFTWLMDACQLYPVFGFQVSKTNVKPRVKPIQFECNIFKYRSVLASMMIKPTFEDPIDTVDDFLQSPFDAMVLANTSIVKLLKMDQRPGIQGVWYRTRFYTILADGNLPSSVENG